MASRRRLHAPAPMVCVQMEISRENEFTINSPSEANGLLEPIIHTWVFTTTGRGVLVHDVVFSFVLLSYHRQKESRLILRIKLSLYQVADLNRVSVCVMINTSGKSNYIVERLYCFDTTNRRMAQKKNWQIKIITSHITHGAVGYASSSSLQLALQDSLRRIVYSNIRRIHQSISWSLFHKVTSI